MIMFRVGVRVRVEQKTYPLSDIFLPLLGEGKTSEREMSGGEYVLDSAALRVSARQREEFTAWRAHIRPRHQRRHQRLPTHDTSPLHTTNTPQISRESNAELARIAAVVTATGPGRPFTVTVGPSPVQLVRQSGKHPIINQSYFTLSG